MSGSTDCAQKEATKFENIANRISNCTERVNMVTNELRGSVNSMVGTEAQDGADPVSPVTDQSILPHIQDLLSSLEERLLDLERENSRLSRLF